MSQTSAIQEYFRWEGQSQVAVVADLATGAKTYFVPLEDIKNYFRANHGKNLTGILKEIFKSQHLPIDADLILRDHTAVLCVLLKIGKAASIEDFAYYEELSDRRLPFDPTHPPSEFPVEDDELFLQDFCEKQWAYCVPVFESHMVHKRFGQQRILPITEVVPNGSDGIANSYVANIYEPHNRLVSNKIEVGIPSTSTFVLKAYSTKESEGSYKREVNGFRSIKNVQSVISFYGSYIQGETRSVLLEFADKGTLEEYFKRETPPSRGVDIIQFWESLFQLITGLKSIHAIRGLHHDVNLNSVVVVSSGNISPFEWLFKLGGFGRGDDSFGVHEGKRYTENPTTYGAPETYALNARDNSSEDDLPELTWAADIWSLGCIYSEAAMWIADGYKGLLDYRQQRRTEAERTVSNCGDCFHDGERVLQCVLDAHRDIEDRLRRSDHITKDILDSMVDEMLWEEDRPSTNALLRKASMSISRARQKSFGKLSRDDYSRPSSSQSHPFPPARSPPTQPLPPIPRGQSPGLASIAEKRKQQPVSNVEKWRAQIRSQNNGMPYTRVDSDKEIPAILKQRLSNSATLSDLNRTRSGSVASWPQSDDNSTTSLITPCASPDDGLQFDFQRHNPNEGKPRVLENHPTTRTHSTYDHQQKPAAQATYELSDNASVVSPILSNPAHPTSVNEDDPSRTQAKDVGKEYHSSQKSVDDTKTIGRTMSRTSSRNSSSLYSTPTNRSHRSEKATESAKPQKRFGAFSLFPTKSQKAALHHSDSSTLNNLSVFEDGSTVSSSGDRGEATTIVDTSSSADYLSVNTCLEWKKAHKKTKKSSKVPPLPGASSLESLKERDHVFIVDDSESMGPIWPEVKKVFEALSYVVKGMSPDGTELFYTVSYDTYLRKDTSALCTYLESKTTKGETNISYRLNLQLQSYQAKFRNASGKGKKVAMRPMSIYILTNGEWGEGPDPKITLKEATDFLTGLKAPAGQITVHFITFSQGDGANQRFEELAKTDFGIDIVDCTPWRGNVLKMLRGPLDRSRYPID